MSDVQHHAAPSPWRGACLQCGGQLMKVHRRPIAGGMPLWAASSIALMVAGATIVSVMDARGWPFGFVLFLFGLWLGIHRFERWQCRRCRTLYRAVVGEDHQADNDKTLRAGSRVG